MRYCFVICHPARNAAKAVASWIRNPSETTQGLSDAIIETAMAIAVASQTSIMDFRRDWRDCGVPRYPLKRAPELASGRTHTASKKPVPWLI